MSTDLGDLITEYYKVYTKWNSSMVNDELKFDLYDLETEIFELLLQKRYNLLTDTSLRELVRKARLFDEIKRKCGEIKE